MARAHWFGMTKIEIKTTDSLENVAQALAEGEHELGDEATLAASQLIGWTGNDCPWFVPHPEHLGDVELGTNAHDDAGWISADAYCREHGI